MLAMWKTVQGLVGAAVDLHIIRIGIQFNAQVSVSLMICDLMLEVSNDWKSELFGYSASLWIVYRLRYGLTA